MSNTMNEHIRHLQERLKEALRERDDALTRIVGLEAMLCDAQREVADLREALRPFAETYREMQRNGWADDAFAGFGTTGQNFARAADLVPDTSIP